MTLARSPTLTNSELVADVERLQTGQAALDRIARNLARRDVFDDVGDGFDERGRRAAATADDVEEAAARPLFDVAGHVLRRVVVAGLGQRIGQTRVGVRAHVAVGDARHLLHVLTQLFRTQRAVQTDGDGVGMRQRVVERFGDLTCKRSARGIGDGAGDHDGQRRAALGEHRLHREDGSLGIQCVEDGLDEDGVGAAVHQAARRLGIVGHQLVEADVARRRVVHVGRDGRGLVGRAEHAGDEARLVRCGEFIASLARQFCPGFVEFVVERFHAVRFQRGRVRAEGVGLDDVRARRQIFAMDGLDDFRLGDHQQVVVAFEVAMPIGKTCAAIVGLGQLVALHHGAHRAIEDEDALLEKLLEKGRCLAHGKERSKRTRILSCSDK